MRTAAFSKMQQSSTLTKGLVLAMTKEEAVNVTLGFSSSFDY